MSPLLTHDGTFGCDGHVSGHQGVAEEHLSLIAKDGQVVSLVAGDIGDAQLRKGGREENGGIQP